MQRFIPSLERVIATLHDSFETKIAWLTLRYLFFFTDACYFSFCENIQKMLAFYGIDIIIMKIIIKLCSKNIILVNLAVNP